MKIQEINDAIVSCRSYLQKADAFSTEFESYVCRYLLILIYSCYERKIREIFVKRFERARNKKNVAFIESILRYALRSILTKDLRGALNRFQSNYGEKFSSKINCSLEYQRAETFFNNLVRDRHDVAHALGANITFLELEESYDESHIILDVLSEILL